MLLKHSFLSSLVFGFRREALDKVQASGGGYGFGTPGDI